MSAANVYLLITVLFFAVPVYILGHQLHHGFTSDEHLAFFVRDWIGFMVIMYAVIGFMTYLFSGTISPTVTGMSNDEKLEYVDLSSGDYQFQPEMSKIEPTFVGFYGWIDTTQTKQVVEIDYVDAEAWDTGLLVDRPKVRIVTVTGNYHVALRFKRDPMRNPKAFADGTAAIPHYADGCSLDFKLIWPVCTHTQYTEKALSKPINAIGLKAIIDKDLQSVTFYVPANYAKALQPTPLNRR